MDAQSHPDIAVFDRLGSHEESLQRTKTARNSELGGSEQAQSFRSPRLCCAKDAIQWNTQSIR
ncbi:hypothetical protein [Thalassovita aquimarina]|uniref:hypothetical protein n=1 Tax=Thalassovita aquimarina TaxID=2785917 RepID=UPI001BAFBC52|nr:hypothetical protein [Thalassovita aquimarina]